MLEAGCEGYKDDILECTPEAYCLTNFQNLQAGEVDWFGHTSEDEVLEIECLLAEPETNNVLDDPVIHLNSITTDNSLAIEDYSCTFNYSIRNGDYGVSDYDAACARKLESNCEFVGGMLQVFEEEPDPHPSCNFADVSADYYLDSGFPDSFHLDYASHSGSYIEHLTSDYQIYPVGSNITTAEKSALSKAISSLPESASNQSSLLLDNMNVNELCDVFPTMCGTITRTNDKQWLNHHLLFGLHNLVEIDNASTYVENGLSSDEKEDNMILIPGNYLAENIYNSFTIIPDSKALIADSGMEKDSHSVEDVASTTYTDVGRVGLGLVEERDILTTTRRRSHKPTQRYIEKTTEMKPRCCNEKLEAPIICYGEKNFHVITDSQCSLKGARPRVMVYQETCGEFDMKLPCVRRARTCRPRKRRNMISKGNDLGGTKPYNLRLLASRKSLSVSESHCEMLDDSAARRTDKIMLRRKHHRLWTLPEVMKLIEGVTQYGVGRWTDIKRLLFSASAYRSSVDLKDKWRNLLRASGAQFFGRTKIETEKKHMAVPIPQSALRKIRELAVIHPYPRERKSRSPSAATATAGLTSNATSISHSGGTSST